MSRIVIIILNYNGWEDTIECLESLQTTLVSKDNEVSLILVDNNSQNDSVERLNSFMENRFAPEYLCTDNLNDAITSKYVLYKSYENKGFSAGNNIGINIALRKQCDYVMLLNNDTVVECNFLSPLLTMLENDTSLGMVGPKICDYYNHNKYTLGGYYSKLKGSGYFYYDTEMANKKYVSFISGCCWLIRSNIFKKCGLMDENYFLYVEDVDYCCCLLKNGYSLSCTKDSVIYHKEGRSTKVKPTLYYYNTRNRLYLCKKLGYGLPTKLVFYVYLLATRIDYYIKMPEIRSYLKKAVLDFRKGKFGKYEQ